jgi:hypothetical protein
MTGRSPEVARELRHGAVEADAAARPGASTANRLQIAFAILVLAYFAAQLVRALIQHREL